MQTVVLSGQQGRAVAAEQLRSAIRGGEFLPAERLVETEFAERFGVTRSALRAALGDLATEGMIEHVPNKGARVRVVTVDEAVVITEVRRELEALCAAKATELASDADLDALGVLGERMQDAVAAGDPVRYSELNKELHERIRVLSGQPVAQDLLGRLNGQLVRHRFRLALRPERPSQSIHEHLAIIDALRARDADAARAAVQAHLTSVIGALRATPEQPL